jgi:hypothetical protein
VATETKAKATLHQRAKHELKEFAILFLYLYITIGAVHAELHTRLAGAGAERRDVRRSGQCIIDKNRSGRISVR